jgi:hypothetical protein
VERGINNLATFVGSIDFRKWETSSAEAVLAAETDFERNGDQRQSF